MLYLPNTIAVFLLLVLIWFKQTSAHEVAADARKHDVAQAVFGILSYTRWPSNPSTLRLCVIGPTEYADEVLQGALLPSDRTVTALRISEDDKEIATQCDSMYVGALSEKAWNQLISKVAGQPVLTISEQQERCSSGGMFCLSVHASHTAFEVNLDSVARSGLRIHPKVLQLARRRGSHG